jgi:hypothetical protein
MKLKWSILGILAFIQIIFTLFYASNYIVVPSTSTYIYEVTKFIFLSIAAFGVLFSTLLSSFNSLESTLNIKARIDFDKTENSFAYMLRWDSDSLKEARDETRRIKKIEKDISQNALLKHISDKESLERSVITMFNFFEEIYLSVKAKRVNETILKEAFANVYTGIYERFKEWIAKNTADEQKKNLENLYETWK